MNWRSLILLLLALGAGTPAFGVYQYVNADGILTILPKPWMIPLAYQRVLEKGQNPYPLYDYNSSFVFKYKDVVADLQVSFRDSTERLKLYGLTVPDTMRRSFQQESIDTLKDLLRDANSVMVVVDQTQRSYSALLMGYLFVDGRFINSELLTAGLAVTSFPDPVPRYRDLMLDAENYARTHDSGMWFYLNAKREPGQDSREQLNRIGAKQPVLADPESMVYHQVWCRKQHGGDPLTEDMARRFGYKPCPYCNLGVLAEKATVMQYEPGTTLDWQEYLKSAEEENLSDIDERKAQEDERRRVEGEKAADRQKELDKAEEADRKNTPAPK